MSGSYSGGGAPIKKKTLIRLLIGLAVLMAVIFVWNFVQEEMAKHTIAASGTIETYPVEVGSRLGGRIQKLDVKEGASVKKGDVLVTLDAYVLPAQRIQLESQLHAAQATLAMLLNGARPQEIAAARAQYQASLAQASLVREGARSEDIEQAEAARRQAEADFTNVSKRQNRFQELLNQHVIAQQEYDDVWRTFVAAREQLTSAQQREKELKAGSRPQEITAAQQAAAANRAQFELLQAGTRTEQIDTQRALIAQIEGQLEELQTNQAELTINAPCNCEVNALPVKAGQLILPNQTIGTLLDLNDLWVQVYIPESRFGLVHPGDEAEVRVDAYPDKVFRGRVTHVSNQAEFTPRNVQTEENRRILVYGVKLALDNSEGLLRPGMPSDVVFHVDASKSHRRSNADNTGTPPLQTRQAPNAP